MKTITLRERVAIDRPAAEVWQIIADYRRDPEWRTGVTTMAPQPPAPVRVGTTTAEELQFAGRTWHNDGEVTGVEDGRRFTWRTVRGAVADGARSVVPLGPVRSEVILELNVTPHGTMRFLRPLTARMLQSTLRNDARRLQALAGATPFVVSQSTVRSD